MSYVESEREKHSILIREGRTTLWSYFAHCSAMCVLIALAVCNGPLLYDYTLIYKGSLDGTVLVQFNKVLHVCNLDTHSNIYVLFNLQLLYTLF